MVVVSMLRFRKEPLMVLQATRTTAEQLLKLTDDTSRYELVRGELVTTQDTLVGWLLV